MKVWTVERALLMGAAAGACYLFAFAYVPALKALLAVVSEALAGVR